MQPERPHSHEQDDGTGEAVPGAGGSATEHAGGHRHEHDHSHNAMGLNLQGAQREQQRRLGIVFGLTLTFMVVELVGGLVSGSLALLADAGHMLSDAAAILLSFLALWLARKATTYRHTYGFRRAEFLAAFVNAAGLVVLAVWIVWEAVQRIGAPQPVLGGVMFWVALAGLGVNLVGIRLLHSHAGENLNLKSAVWHIMGDLLGSVGALLAAGVITLTGWTLADPLVSLFIAVLIGFSGVRILFDSANLLMDKVPAEIDTQAVADFLGAYPGVRGICDLHIWGVSSAETMLTAHLLVADEVDRDAFLHQLLHDLQEHFELAHMTVQLESDMHASCPQEW